MKTNLEAADEIARQVRLRDLAGLIVIDFIDMEDHQHIIAVERRLREAFRNDRARIQMGKIGPFGLLELSRQRLRPSILESSAHPCLHCNGTGYIRSIESTSLYILRVSEEEALSGKVSELQIHVPTLVAFYILNTKREHLQQLETRLQVKVFVEGDDSLMGSSYRITRLKRRPEDNTEAPNKTSVLQPFPSESSGHPREEQKRASESTTQHPVSPSETPFTSGTPSNNRGHNRCSRQRYTKNREGRSFDIASAPVMNEISPSPASEDLDQGHQREVSPQNRETTTNRRRHRSKRGRHFYRREPLSRKENDGTLVETAYVSLIQKDTIEISAPHKPLSENPPESSSSKTETKKKD